LVSKNHNADVSQMKIRPKQDGQSTGPDVCRADPRRHPAAREQAVHRDGRPELEQRQGDGNRRGPRLDRDATGESRHVDREESVEVAWRYECRQERHSIANARAA
jgi:hypothetical protein